MQNYWLGTLDKQLTATAKDMKFQNLFLWGGSGQVEMGKEILLTMTIT